MRPTATAWDTALRAGSESVVCDLQPTRAFAQALCARADVVLEGFRPGVAARLGIGPDDVPDTAVYCSITGFGDERAAPLARGPRRQLPRLGGRPRGHGARAPAGPGRRPRRRRTWCRDAGARRAPRARADRAGREDRRLDDPSLARPRRASARRRAGAAHAHRRARVLPDLRDRRRAPPHGRRARAEVLPASLRARRAARPRRRGSTTRIRTRSRPSSPAIFATRTLADWLDALRRRGRVRRPRLDARGGCGGVRSTRTRRPRSRSARTRKPGGASSRL